MFSCRESLLYFAILHKDGAGPMFDEQKIFNLIFDIVNINPLKKHSRLTRYLVIYNKVARSKIRSSNVQN